MESHQTDGCSEAEAEAAALAELGDPAAAAKRFRRQHLTDKEARRLNSILRQFGWFPWAEVIFGGSVLCAGLALYCLSFHFHRALYLPLIAITFSCALLMYAGFALIGFFVARRTSSKSDLRLLVLMHILRGGYLIFIPIYCVRLCVWDCWKLLLASLILQTIPLVLNLLLWVKLGQIDGVGPEMPSRGARAS